MVSQVTWTHRVAHDRRKFWFPRDMRNGVRKITFVINKYPPEDKIKLLVNILTLKTAIYVHIRSMSDVH